MTTLTPFMDLTLPDISTFNTLGTLSQDWALYINANIVSIDEHDHAELGNQVPSEDIVSSEDIDLNQVSITNVQYLTFETGTNPQPLSLFTDGTDLFFENFEGKTTQITIAGGLNFVTTIGGFFGEYGSSGAVAFLDTISSFFGFLGVGPTNLDIATIKMDSLTFNSTDGTQTLTSLTMPTPLTSVSPGSFTFTGATWPRRSIATNAAGVYEFSNVVGDGSDYSTTLKNVPITDPDGIYHLNAVDRTIFPFPTARLSPNLCWHSSPDTRAAYANPNYIEVFGSSSIVSLGTYWPPLYTESFSILHTLPIFAKTPHWDGTYAVNLCKWALGFPNQSGNGQVNQIYRSFLCQIQSVTYVGNGEFIVNGTVTNITDTGIQFPFPPTNFIMSMLRIAAVFPRFNGQGVFFGEQY